MAKQVITDETGQKYVKEVPSTRPRTAELVLGIMGGIFGMLAGLFAMAFGSFGDAWGVAQSGTITNLGWGCVAASALAIIFTALINKNHQLFGGLLIACGLLNFIFVSYFGILSGLLIIIAGSLALRK